VPDWSSIHARSASRIDRAEYSRPIISRANVLERTWCHHRESRLDRRWQAERPSGRTLRSRPMRRRHKKRCTSARREKPDGQEALSD
jgi:hypothetical protein